MDGDFPCFLTWGCPFLFWWTDENFNGAGNHRGVLIYFLFYAGLRWLFFYVRQRGVLISFLFYAGLLMDGDLVFFSMWGAPFLCFFWRKTFFYFDDHMRTLMARIVSWFVWIFFSFFNDEHFLSHRDFPFILSAAILFYFHEHMEALYFLYTTNFFLELAISLTLNVTDVFFVGLGHLCYTRFLFILIVNFTIQRCN